MRALPHGGGASSSSGIDRAVAADPGATAVIAVFLIIVALFHVLYVWRLVRGPRRSLFAREFIARREWLIDLVRREAAPTETVLWAPTETVLWAAADEPLLAPCSCTRRIQCSLCKSSLSDVCARRPQPLLLLLLRPPAAPT